MRSDFGIIKASRNSVTSTAPALTKSPVMEAIMANTILPKPILISRTPEYRVYGHARTRCTNPNYPDYHRYGGRGIEFRFNNFDEFIQDVGNRPSKEYSLDRIDVNGHYEKGNVRWATGREQGRNRSNNSWLTFQGKTLCITDWAETLGMPQQTISSRVHRGWCAECALTQPTQPKKGTCVHREKPSRPKRLPVQRAYCVRVKGFPDTILAALTRHKAQYRVYKALRECGYRYNLKGKEIVVTRAPQYDKWALADKGVQLYTREVIEQLERGETK